MKTITVLLAAATLLLGASASPLATRKSNSWAGTSLYYLHGLADSEQDAYLSALASDGAKVVRIWGKWPLFPSLACSTGPTTMLTTYSQRHHGERVR
jgi:hypothetical protein